jgi:small multidrug resistance pump
MTLLLLALAIASEVTATVSLKISDGFSKLVPSIIVVIGYSAAFFFLSQALKRGMASGRPSVSRRSRSSVCCSWMSG